MVSQKAQGLMRAGKVTIRKPSYSAVRSVFETVSGTV